MSPNDTASFWSRMGLREEDGDICIRAIETLYPNHRVDELDDQGYCSFTIAVSPLGLHPNHIEDTKDCIVQIRPKQHSLDLDIATVAHKTYGPLVPKVRQLPCLLPGSLIAVEMTRLSGVPLSKISIQNGTPEQKTALIQSFAMFIAKAWRTPLNINDDDVRCAFPIPSSLSMPLLTGIHLPDTPEPTHPPKPTG